MEQHNSEVDTSNRTRLMKLSTYFTVFGVFLIILLKIYGWFATSSVTILASLVDSALDICVSIMNLFAVHYSLKPADDEHRFGHGKIEDIAVFLQSLFFGASGLALIFEAAMRFNTQNEQVVETSKISISIMFCSIIINLMIVSFQRYVIKRSNSQVILADSMHYFVDFLSNIVAVIGIAMAAYFKLSIFDDATALLIACYIIYNAYKLLKNSYNNLMDRELDDDAKQTIKDIINSHKEILGFHDLKTRAGGGKTFIQFHLVLDKKMTLEKTHDIVTEIEEKIIEKFPSAELIVHQDPEGVEEHITYTD